jgi:hypothetical protein
MECLFPEITENSHAHDLQRILRTSLLLLKEHSPYIKHDGSLRKLEFALLCAIVDLMRFDKPEQERRSARQPGKRRPSGRCNDPPWWWWIRSVRRVAPLPPGTRAPRMACACSMTSPSRDSLSTASPHCLTAPMAKSEKVKRPMNL